MAVVDYAQEVRAAVAYVCFDFRDYSFCLVGRVGVGECQCLVYDVFYFLFHDNCLSLVSYICGVVKRLMVPHGGTDASI